MGFATFWKLLERRFCRRSEVAARSRIAPFALPPLQGLDIASPVSVGVGGDETIGRPELLPERHACEFFRHVHAVGLSEPEMIFRFECTYAWVLFHLQHFRVRVGISTQDRIVRYVDRCQNAYCVILTHGL